LQPFAVALIPGTRLGPYEIVAVIGAGGMGQVYRARDPRLGRDVAIKVSADRFSDRFEREAHAIAALNHPHICTLHDVGPNYLVMELVDGPSLAERIQEAPIPLDEALHIARQIADALDAAHLRGIIHRDLKPANVKITGEGVVKVLDFGLAKHTEFGADDSNPEASPTMPAPTGAGMFLGTAAYMAPEQARGRPVDKRADIWAFGVVLYEMLRGVRLFDGDTASDTIAAVLTTEPAWDAIPERVRPLLRHCLAKDPKQRLRDIGDIDLLLRDAPPTAEQTKRSSRAAWSVAAAALVAATVLALVHFRERRPTAAPMRFQIPSTVSLAASGNIALSPDGRHFAFMAAGADGLVRVWVREMDSLEMRPLPGSETAANAPPFFWSADSRFIAFESGGKLKKLNVAGGPAQTLCDLPGTAIGGSWNHTGDIIVGNITGGILRVPDTGGSSTPVTTIDPSRKENSHLVPTFLPDDRHFVYVRVSRTAPESSGIYLGSLDEKPGDQSSRRLLPYAPGLTYAPSIDGGVAHVLFVREGALMAQPFDERRLQLAGDPVPLAEEVGVYLDTAFFSVSRSGILIYRTADPSFPITWFDRQGNVVGRVSEPGQFASVALSPDGSRAVAALTNPHDRANADLWLIDLARGSRTRFTSNPGVRADFPVWSPDGKRIAFRTSGPGATSIHQKLVSASQEEASIDRSSVGLVTPVSWSADGRFLIFAGTDPITAWDLWVLRLDRGSSTDGREAFPFVRTKFNEDDGRFSPDGRWVAYVSNESGVKEVYVRDFAAAFTNGDTAVAGSRLVSKGGGSSPRWRRDGRELFYLAPNGTMMAIDVTTGSEFHAETPTPLFQTPPGTIVGDVTPDGKRFLLVQSGAAPFTVLLNWQFALSAQEGR
jgi:Tol biopolymer transport system component